MEMTLICRVRMSYRNVPLIKPMSMPKKTIGQKIKDLRLRSGLSQDDLANVSELSSRTIQRIENGETVPRGDSLKRISKALNMNVESLYLADIHKEHETVLKNNKWVILGINLAAFGYLISPILGVLFPLFLWAIFKEKTIGANEAGKRIMKFELVWFFLLFMVYLYIYGLKFVHLNLPVPENGKLLVIIIVTMYILNIFIIGFNIIKAFRSLDLLLWLKGSRI
jgi:transcriptional regulator with XRE-family HTH domain